MGEGRGTVDDEGVETTPEEQDTSDAGRARAAMIAEVQEVPAGPITPEERAELEARFLAEVEQDHVRGLERVERKMANARLTHQERVARERMREVRLLRDAVRKKFYQDHGYQRIEENGRERWISPEEHALRQKTRSRSNPRAVGARVNRKRRMLPLYLLLVLIAMAIGAFLVR